MSESAVPLPDVSGSSSDLQTLCEQGSFELMETRYWEAEWLLARAERLAWEARDYDTLARLYMPLQEARRQRRQRCGEGAVALALLPEGPADRVEPAHVIAHYPQGQLLVAGWGSIEPAVEIRKLAERNGLYVETFLAAAYPVGAGRAVVIVPTEDVMLPPANRAWAIDDLIARVPPQSIVLAEAQLPAGVRMGTPETFAEVMAMWERLHAPFLALADATQDPHAKIDGYRRTLRVDYACELAHQKLSDVAKALDARK
ncbi:MAG TPA: hypothetical protein VK986_09115 [Tepidisphaeraceae bacterium]|nr:hypothetical protein [Tepidisphaeraceae bacterium]